jgi:hypothetical protein
VLAPLLPQLMRGDAAQLVIHQGKDLLGRLPIAGAPLLEQLGDRGLSGSRRHAIRVYGRGESGTGISRQRAPPPSLPDNGWPERSRPVCRSSSNFFRVRCKNRGGFYPFLRRFQGKRGWGEGHRAKEKKARGELERQLETVRARRQNLLVRSLDDDPHDQTQRSLYERVRTELAEEERRLTREIGRLRLRLERIVRIVKMALEIAACCNRAFVADQDPDYRGLIARVIFRQVRMRDGSISDGILTDPLAYFRRWAGEKPLQRLADLASLGAPPGSVVDGCTKQPQRPISLSRIRNDLLKIQEKLTPDYEDDIESCYHELCARGLIYSNSSSSPSTGTSKL